VARLRRRRPARRLGEPLLDERLDLAWIRSLLDVPGVRHDRARRLHRVGHVHRLARQHPAALLRLLPRVEVTLAAGVEQRMDVVEHLPRPEPLAHQQAVERVLLDRRVELPVRAVG
jgi:hypothetical protein